MHVSGCRLTRFSNGDYAQAALVGVIDSGNNMSVVVPGIGTFADGKCNTPANIILNGCDAMTGQLRANFKVGIGSRVNGGNTTLALVRIPTCCVGRRPVGEA